MKEKLALVDNYIEQRYEIDIEGHTAFVEYVKQPGVIILTHAEVPGRFEGQGYGSDLVKAVLADVRSKGLQVVPQCGFVALYIRRHPEWEDLVLKKTPVK